MALNRRSFMKTTAAVSAGYWVAGGVQAKESRSANERIRFGCIGINGKGSSDSGDAASHGDIVAICDIDEKFLDRAERRFSGAQRYVDFRKMLEENEGKIDAVTVSTPDHTHAAASVMAMKMGMGVYCQKPLTHSIWEARVMGDVAKESGVATQMGNQGTAGSGLRKAAAVVQGGHIGDVSEVHVWTNRPIWPQGGPFPAPEEAPSHVHWDLWLGPAAERPYAKGFHPFAWRGWWPFGTGALGDMACHTMNMPYMALDLKDPVTLEAEAPEINRESYPRFSVITYEFPATDKRPAVKLVWYDGGKLPDSSLFDGEKPSESGSLLIGSKGKLYSPGDYGSEFRILGGEVPDVEFEQSPGHFVEWVEAIKGGQPARSNFPGYSAGLTETVLLGNLALWAGKKVEWDAQAMKATNAPECDELIKPAYREGWSL